MEQRKAGWWPMMLENLKARTKSLKREIHALFLAARDSRTPWYARAVIICVVAYALSPIDLIPDFIPVLGYLDDLIIVPLGIALVVRLIPSDVMAEHRTQAAAAQNRPVSLAGATVVIAAWLAALCLVGWLGYRYVSGI
jgi:uncharacterized membrane protein YkvA (DUF1232 family)